MNIRRLFGISVLVSLIAFGMVTNLYMPFTRAPSRSEL